MVKGNRSRGLLAPAELLANLIVTCADYAIPGTPATGSQQCSFTYRSSSGQKLGWFISPRHPSYYPDSTVCDYNFIGQKNEQVRITFENFNVENGGAKYAFCHFDHFNQDLRAGLYQHDSV